jgi:predicted glycosyltransferase involved in capsule biosynthesis
MLNNSIIVAYRNRPMYLKAFLHAISLTIGNLKDEVEIVISDLGSGTEETSIIKQYSKYLNIDYKNFYYDGVFCKSRALNNCVLRSSGELITLLDIDCLVSTNFFRKIKNYFSIKDNRATRLSHRVYKVNDKLTKLFVGRTFKYNELKQMFNNYKNFTIAKERKFINGVMCECNSKIEEKGKAILGCSHFTMLKDNYMSLGGYDERYIGYGCEDLDFNLRFIRKYKVAVLNNKFLSSLYHMSHPRFSGWNSQLCRENVDLLEYCKKNNIVDLPITSSWGQF